MIVIEGAFLYLDLAAFDLPAGCIQLFLQIFILFFQKVNIQFLPLSALLGCLPVLEFLQLLRLKRQLILDHLFLFGIDSFLRFDECDLIDVLIFVRRPLLLAIYGVGLLLILVGELQLFFLEVRLRVPVYIFLKIL